MKIKAIWLRNIRSHKETYIEFKDGFNCLIGGLGAGKTSVLYAIDFALFGEPLGRSYAYLLREGASEGRVVLAFSHAGSNYRLVRGLRRTGTGIEQNPSQLELYKDGNLIAERRVSSVKEQLKKELGLDSEVFREVIWIRQEKLKEILDMKPSERQKKIDKLLGLEEFEEARRRLGSIERTYKGMLEAYRTDTDLVMARSLEEKHAKLVEELASMAVELEGLRQEHEDATKAVEEALTNLKALEEARKKQEELLRKKVELLTSQREVEREVKRLAAELERRKEAKERLEKQLKELVAREMKLRSTLALSGLGAGASIEEAEGLLEEWRGRIEELRREVVGLEQAIRGHEESLSVISREARCPTCLRFIDEEYRRKMTSKLKREIVEMRHKLDDYRSELSELEGRSSGLEEAISGLRLVEARKSELEARLKDEEEGLELVEKELDRARMRLEMLKVELDALEAELVGPSDEEIEGAREALEGARKHLSEVEARMRELEVRRSMLKEQIADLERRLKAVEEKRAKMEKVSKVLELIKLLRSAYKAVRPHLRSEVIRLARFYIQRTLDEISGPEGAGMVVEIGQDYTPVIKVGGRERSVAHLSGGERTLLALAYRIGMGHLIMQYRTGHGLDLLLLDEPTESLGREDLSIDRLADAISRLRGVGQIIAVSHSEAFAERADHVIRIEKVDNESRVRTEERP